MALVSKNFSDIITFSRASAATRVNASGLLESVAANTPRFDFDPITLAARGILIEEQRTNLLTYGQDLDNSSWSKSNATVIPNSAVAPDGSTSADKLTEDATNNTHVLINQSAGPQPAGTYTYSIYAKAAGRTKFYLSQTVTTAYSVTFDLSAVTATSSEGGAVGSIKSVGNGWYLCSMTFTTSTTISLSFVMYLMTTGTSYLGDGVSGVHFWGAQTEAGAFPTSYIPSTTTFTGRSSTGTFIGANGLIQTAASGVARYQYNPALPTVPPFLLLEAAATNLLAYSEYFDNAVWNKGTAGLVTPDAAVSPDGSLDADAYTWPSGSGVWAFLAQSVTGNATTTHTFSIWLKRPSGSGSRTLRLVLSDVSLSTAQSPTVTVTEQWQRFEFSRASANNTGSIGIGLASGTSGVSMAAGEIVHVWGAQLEAGSFATSYIPSTVTFTGRSSTGTFIGYNGLIQTASSGVARYQYNPANLSAPPFLLLEAAATNLLTYSQDFDNAAWTKVDASVTANATTAPDGALTADSLVANGVNTIHFNNQALVVAVDTYTLSIYAKANGYRIVLFTNNGGSNVARGFDLSNGTTFANTYGYAEPSSFAITPAGNGWYRCSITFQKTVSISCSFGYWLNNGTSDAFAGNGTSGVFVWGAQLEAGSYATSYIPTTTATVTRAADTSTSATTTRAADTSTSSQTTRSADVASVNTLSPWYNATEGTINVEYTPTVLGSYTPVSINANNTNFRMQHTAFTGGSFGFFVVDGGNGQANINAGSAVVGSTNKAAAAYKANDFAVSVNNSAAQVDTSGTVPSVSIMYVGSLLNSTEPLNGWVRSIKYFPRRLTNTELQALTA